MIKPGEKVEEKETEKKEKKPPQINMFKQRACRSARLCMVMRLSGGEGARDEAADAEA